MEERLYFHNLDKIRFFAAFAIFSDMACRDLLAIFIQQKANFQLLFFNALE